jgi:hypothetical protein
MAYLPKHYIRTGLVADNNFTDKITGEPYTGAYYEIATGQYFSGIGPQDATTREIIPFGNIQAPQGTEFQNVSVAFNLDVPTPIKTTPLNELQRPGFNYQVFQPQIVDAYTTIKKFQPEYYNSRIQPYQVTPIPDEQDYAVGEYIRYFCKKVNESLYLELDKIQYDGFSERDPRYFYDQYLTFTIPWSITGSKETVFKTNRDVVLKTMKVLNLYNLDKHLQENYLLFYKES